jgi:serine/threonine-protein kinase
MVAPFIPELILGGRYKVDRSIAAGGMAEVWRAFDTQLHREVAIKALKEHSRQDPVVVERFKREAKALAKLDHPNIVPVYDIVEHEGHMYVVMQLVKGKSLRDILDLRRRDTGGEPPRLSPATTVHIGRSIALALKHAHDHGILHRDIKPANILVDKAGKVLLTDFGIAKEMSGGTESDLTTANIMMGTAKYLSPEQVRGHELNAPADLYALGLVLYECLAGDVPFKGSNDQQTAILRLQRDPTPLQSVSRDVPPALVNVIHRLLRRKPDDRFRNGLEVANALQAALAGSPDAPTPPMGGVGDLRSAPFTPADRTPRRNSRPQYTDVPGSRRDRTPQGNVRSREALPRSQKSHTSRELLPIALLLVAAVIVGALLWNGLRGDSTPGAAPVDSSATITKISSFDPNGDDGQENESMVVALTDGLVGTRWTTVCYGNQYFGSKVGVGLVATLSAAARGTITANIGSAPWKVEIYSSTNGAPNTIEGWGAPVASKSNDNVGQFTFKVPNPATSVLFLFREIGRHGSCSDTNPYKGVVGELSFAAN